MSYTEKLDTKVSKRTLALVQEHFWWPKVEEDCTALVRGCQHCKIFEGAVLKAPLCPIQAYMPLELVHVDFTSIETTMELNLPPSAKNVLVLMDHFTRYAMSFVTKDEKAKLLRKFFISDSSQCLVNLLNYSVTKMQTSSPHWLKSSVQPLAFRNAGAQHINTQCNGQVEGIHQTLFRMIGKLAMDKKAQWEQHLPELLQVYNST